MPQVEFENQLRELNGQKAQVINMYALMQNEVKEEIAEKNRQIHELSEQVQRLKVQRAGLNERRLKAERELGDKIRKFTSENFSDTRALADVSEWSLAAELRHRGYTGQLINPEKGEEFMMNLNGKLNGCINGKAYGKED